MRRRRPCSELRCSCTYSFTFANVFIFTFTFTVLRQGTSRFANSDAASSCIQTPNLSFSDLRCLPRNPQFPNFLPILGLGSSFFADLLLHMSNADYSGSVGSGKEEDVMAVAVDINALKHLIALNNTNMLPPLDPGMLFQSLIRECVFHFGYGNAFPIFWPESVSYFGLRNLLLHSRK